MHTLTPGQVEHYWRKGWVAVPDVFLAEEVDTLARLAIQASYAEMLSSGQPNYLVDVAPNGMMAPRKLEMPSLTDDRFRAFLFEGRIVSLVTSLLRESPVLIRDQLFMKPPEIGSEKPFHQDLAHFHCDPADGMLATWVALDDACKANGCLRYIDGSHHGPLWPHTVVPDAAYDLVPPAEAIDRARESVADVTKGSVILHHSKVLHTTGPNHTTSWRRAYSSHWVSPSVSVPRAVRETMYIPSNG
jgi:phytanoyl-CoA hydroxylase